MNYNEQLLKTKREILNKIERIILDQGVDVYKFEDIQPCLYWCDAHLAIAEWLEEIQVIDGELHFKTDEETTTSDKLDGYSVESLANLLNTIEENIANERDADLKEIQMLAGQHMGFEGDGRDMRWGNLEEIDLTHDGKYAITFETQVGIHSCMMSEMSNKDVKRILEIVKAQKPKTYLINVTGDFHTMYDITADSAEEAVQIAKGIFNENFDEDEFNDLKFFT